MTFIKNIRRFNRKNFTVEVNAVEEEDPDFSFNEEVEKQVNDGELMVFGVKVTVYCRGAKVGSDYLGNCIHETPRDFMDHFGLRAKARKDNVVYGSYFTDMVHAAIQQARENITAMQGIRLRD